MLWRKSPLIAKEIVTQLFESCIVHLIKRGSTVMARPVKLAVHTCTPRFGASRLQMCALLLASALCPAQEVEIPDNGHILSFGVTVVASGWLKGEIYPLKEDATSLPNFKKLKPIGSIYAPALNLPTRNFIEGFPGVTDRSEHFAIDYHGRFWIAKPGLYRFALESDDGAKLYIDSKTIINNDGIHSPTTKIGAVRLDEGDHTIRVSYFQGPRYQIALRVTENMTERASQCKN
jgi:hypothetical protein